MEIDFIDIVNLLKKSLAVHVMFLDGLIIKCEFSRLFIKVPSFMMIIEPDEIVERCHPVLL